jgi:hypothetical protein
MMRRMIAVVALALTGCALASGALSNIDPGGRPFATVDADKLASWHAAEAVAGGTHTRSAVMMMPMAAFAYLNPDGRLQRATRRSNATPRPAS